MNSMRTELFKAIGIQAWGIPYALISAYIAQDRSEAVAEAFEPRDPRQRFGQGGGILHGERDCAQSVQTVIAMAGAPDRALERNRWMKSWVMSSLRDQCAVSPRGVTRNPTACLNGIAEGQAITSASASCCQRISPAPTSATEAIGRSSSLASRPRERTLIFSPGFGTTMHHAYTAPSRPSVKRKSAELNGSAAVAAPSLPR